MGMWNTHGMHKDEDFQRDAISTLGFIPEELVMLADNAEKEAWIARKVAEHERGQKKRKGNLMAGYWTRRARRFKELAAALEQEVTEEIEADEERKQNLT
jgi:hypothetical protein